MSQRSFTNDRYRKDAKVGSTRKSAAKAKPVRKLGEATSSAKPAPSKSSAAKAKPKPKDGIERDWSGLPTSPEIKKYRKIWWVLLLTGLGMIGITYVVPQFRGDEQIARVVSLLVVGVSAAAIYLDLVVIRKLRKELMESAGKKKSGKAGKAPAPATSDNEALAKKSGKDSS